MKRRDFLKSAGCAAAATTVVPSFLGSQMLAGTAPTAGKKPNIMFILADDLGIGDVGCYGADHYKTPNIDALAAGGTRYNHFYISPLCGPSRALIMTGRYAFRTGATNQDATGEMKSTVEKFTPSYIKQAGYKTAMVGKWGQLPLGPGLGPDGFGFDEYLRFTGSGIYWNTQAKGKTYVVNGKVVPLHDHEYLPDVLHNFAVDFITRNQDNPWYVYYSMSHVHREILPTPDSPKTHTTLNQLYTDNIAYMDKLVGKMMAELERLKLRENTLVIFVGDNGTAGESADESTIGGRRLSGNKGTMLEGGALVPFIINWPGRTPAGKVSNEMMEAVDFIPTWAEFTGVKLPSDVVLDGKSIVPQIYGRKPEQVHDIIYVQLGPKWYVRDQMWKLDQSGDLFDMSKAPFEEHLVTSKSPEAVAARTRLQAELDRLNPAGGILDAGDGSGRHAGKAPKKEKKNKGGE
jgi:arylsulfatase A